MTTRHRQTGTHTHTHKHTHTHTHTHRNVYSHKHAHVQRGQNKKKVMQKKTTHLKKGTVVKADGSIAHKHINATKLVFRGGGIIARLKQNSREHKQTSTGISTQPHTHKR